jgi:hypothetical protein
MAASGAQGAGLGGGDELDAHPGAHEEGAPPIGLGNQQEGAPAAAGGAPDPLAGLGQTNVRALAAREIVPDAEVWDVAQWPKNRSSDEEEEDFDEFPYDSDAEDSGNGDEEDEGNGDEDEDDEDL